MSLQCDSTLAYLYMYLCTSRHTGGDGCTSIHTQMTKSRSRAIGIKAIKFTSISHLWHLQPNVCRTLDWSRDEKQSPFHLTLHKIFGIEYIYTAQSYRIPMCLLGNHIGIRKCIAVHHSNGVQNDPLVHKITKKYVQKSNIKTLFWTINGIFF